MNDGVDSLSARPNDIVVVDDDTLVLERVRRNLRDTDWVVTCFLDAEEALTHLQESQTVKVVIVDNRMPRIDGVEFLEKLVSGTEIEAPRFFLCSTVRPPQDVSGRVQQLGARILSKDVLCDKEALLDVLEQGSTAEL